MQGMRLVGRSGGALPGLVVERIYKRFLPKALKQLPKGVIVVTGTNGKTTTTKVLSELLQAHGYRVLTNQTGSNFVRGTIAAVLDRIGWNGKLAYDVAVFELDEAFAVQFVKLVKPNGVLALNVMRDQMDRFGEIDTTAKMIGKVVGAAQDFVVLNANDPRIAELATHVTAKQTLWFGHSKELTKQFLTDDQHHHQDDVAFREAAPPVVRLDSVNHTKLTFQINGKVMTYQVRLDGTHNAINVAAVLATLMAVHPSADEEITASSLADITPAFGRGERIELQNGAVLQLQLIKNPGGFTHALRTLDDEPYGAVGIAINDDYADGRDVSWLWDVEFDKIKAAKVCTGGTRGYDMAVRLKYDGVPVTSTADTLSAMLDEMLGAATGERAVLFCTYTAMLTFRKLLRARGVAIEEVGL